MSHKTDSIVVVDSSGPSAFESDLDEDLDLTDTKLLSSDDEQLKQYIDIPASAERTVDSDDDFVESFRFVPLTSEALIEKRTEVVQKDSPVVLSDEDEQQKDLTLTSASIDDLPDYESPPEEEIREIKFVHDDSPDKIDSDLLPYDDSLEVSAHDVASDEKMDDDCAVDSDDDDDDDDFDEQSSRKSKAEKFNVARISPYNVKNRNKYVKGKGKQPMSGRCRYKSSNKGKSADSSGSSEELLFSAADIPVDMPDCLAEGLVDVKQEEKPLVPVAPMLCEACSVEEGHNSMVQCCDGHIVCTRCVEASAKKVLVGEKKGSVECPQSDCSSTVPLSELRKALPAIVLDLLEDKWNKETLEALENMKDVVKCPGCSFSAVLDISLKRFQCIQCNEAYCRYCELKWSERKTHDLCIRTKQWTSTVTGNVVNIPARWSDVTEDSTSGKTESHTLVKLDSNSEEFLDVVHCMNKHMNTRVKKIYRVQNERLWEKYSLTRSHMVADLGELNINEERLFHGTHRDVIEAICREGFDWRLCGKHGTVYGQGMYFARSPVISHRYSSGISSSRRAAFFPAGIFVHNTSRPAFSAAVTTTPSTGFTFGAPRPSAQSSGLRFGMSTAATATQSSGTFFTFGGSSNRPNPGLRFGSTASSSNSGPDTNVGFFGAAHSKQCMFRNSGNPGGNSNNSNNNLPTSTGIHLSKSTQCTDSLTSKDDDKSHGSRPCSNCIFCSSKKKTITTDAGKTSTASGMSVQNPQPTSQNPGSTGAVPAVTSSGSASSACGNHGSLALFWKEVAKQRNRKLLMDMSNTGAHLFVKHVPATSTGLSFGGNSNNNSGGSSNSGFWFGSGSSNTGGSGGNSGNSTRSSGLFGVGDSDDDEGDCLMFLARVLVGRSCLGSPDMRRPERNRAGQETHSAVDREQQPTIFVIFDNNQCYPEYIIQYSTNSRV